MKLKPHLPNPPGTSGFAALRLAGFLGLVVLLAPVQLAVLVSGRGDPVELARFFHRRLTRLLGFHVRRHGRMAGADGLGPVLYVANHVSYLDIPVLGSLIPASFVAKAEVEKWPLFGLLARMQNTVFIERRSARAGTHRSALRERLEKGDNLIVFPEGTSSDGQRTLPFKSTLFSVVEQDLLSGGEVRIQPVSIACTEIGGLPMGRDWRPYYAWYGDMTLLKHLWDVFKIGHFTIDVVFHEPVTMARFGDRKSLALHCQKLTASGVEKALRGRLEKDLAV